LRSEVENFFLGNALAMIGLKSAFGIPPVTGNYTHVGTRVTQACRKDTNHQDAKCSFSGDAIRLMNYSDDVVSGPTRGL
jgi:hypothetical protein